MLRKIALSSMKGRKKDTLVLSSVIILSFIFIVITTIFHASAEMTKYEQKVAMFGKWDFAYYNGNQDIQKSLLELEDVNKLGISRIIGKSSTCGNIGTINQDLIDLGAFHLYEGKLPERDDEIALELNQLKEFPSDIKVGDTIPIRIDFPVSKRDYDTVVIEQDSIVMQEIEELQEQGIANHIDSEEVYIKHVYHLNRNVQSLESFNGTEIGAYTNYLYRFLRLDEESIYNPNDYLQDVPKYGSILSQKHYITRNMVVTGIVQTYSNIWDKGYHPVANAFITEDTGKLLIEDGYFLSEVVDNSSYKTPYNLFIDTKLVPENFSNKYIDEFEKLMLNSYLHSDTEDSTEVTMTYGILLAVFIATIISVFLIYFTQIRRRARRIALLKSIGATNGQIVKLILWEVCNLLIILIPIGVAAGMELGKLVLGMTNKHGRTELNFHVDYRLMTLGVLVGCIAIFIGILAPMIISLKIPLIGTISELPRRKKTLKIKPMKIFYNNQVNRVSKKNKEVNFDMKVQSFGRISLKNIKYNIKNYLMVLGLYTITISVLLGSIFLGYLSFSFYIDNIVVTGKPSYGYEVNYGLPREDIDNYREELKSIEGVTNINVSKGGDGALLWYEGIEQNRLYSEFQSILPSNLISKHFGAKNTEFINLYSEYLVEDAIVANIYGIDVNTDIYEELRNAITKGALDKERFEAGKEVIVLSPIYESIVGDIEETHNDDMNILLDTEQRNRMKALLRYNNLYDITYDFRKSENYSHDSSVEIGDSIYLTILNESTINTFKSYDVKVGAIIHYFPDKGIWPFSETIENPVVIGSYSFTERLYPATIKSRYIKSNINLSSMLKNKIPAKYGKSWIFIETDNDSFKPQSLISLQDIARERGFKLHEYKEVNDIAFKKAFNSATIPVVLGIAVAIINSIILYNISLSKLEQERDRIGTFQALGVMKGEFKKQYLIVGFVYGLISLIIFHILFALTISFTSIGKVSFMSMNIEKYINYIVSKQLWLYPWGIHIIICIIFFVATILTYYLPLRKIIDNQPMDNIRSLGR
ncbi:ABC transporter permease [Tissierella sp.]|uniref:ABC transporter permease n=1 Tax=Tissierella sp. TaxID=41274 RepID=UPI0028679F05|nr:ABC transporter permease [Tissierella sp.]MDR7857738.1 ABC transporter permease [Tissierella sp.]